MDHFQERIDSGELTDEEVEGHKAIIKDAKDQIQEIKDRLIKRLEEEAKVAKETKIDEIKEKEETELDKLAKKEEKAIEKIKDVGEGETVNNKELETAKERV